MCVQLAHASARSDTSEVSSKILNGNTLEDVREHVAQFGMCGYVDPALLRN